MKSTSKTKAQAYILILVVCCLATDRLSLQAVAAKPLFKSYELKSKHKEIMWFDFDGDGLDDIITIDESNLRFFFQDAKHGFSKNANLVYALGDKPSVLWSAKLGNSVGQNIFVMTDDGVWSLTFVGKTTAPARKQIINRQTLIPDKCENPSVISFTLSANTATDFPLIFVPTQDALEIWQYDKQWQRAGVLEGIPTTRLWAPHRRTGYVKQYLLDMNIGDLNNDGLDDLVVCDKGEPIISYNVYIQTKEGTFPTTPTQSFKDQWNWRSWVSLIDVNRDGMVDFIKNRCLDEPWFIPGTSSGKVVVHIYLAAADGNIPDKPTFIFRKSDWISSMPIVDVDGDGFIDMVLGYSLLRGREDIMKSVTAKKMDHNLRFHFSDNGRFGQQPDCQKDLAIRFDKSGMHIHLTFSRRHHIRKQINLDGDFNGDGCQDLLVKDAKGKASVYFFISRKKGFSKKADMYFDNIDNVERFIVSDLNKDRISDLMVIGAKEDRFRVFISKRK